jgi:hypothetical protein
MEKVIINLTQHSASVEQRDAGVIDLPQPYRSELAKLLTFTELPIADEIKDRAAGIYKLIVDFCMDKNSPIKDEVKEMLKNGELDEVEFKKLNLSFMIGGALWLMKPLIEELSKIGNPLFAFTKRVVEEVKLPDGTIEKKAIFKHEGFIPAI